MNHQAANYLKTHRNKSGLSQRELGELLGYGDPAGQTSRHERSSSTPSLAAALAYETIFRVPVSEIFDGMHGSIKRDIEGKLQRLELDLANRSAKDRDATLVAQKLLWLNERKSA